MAVVHTIGGRIVLDFWASKTAGGDLNGAVQVDIVPQHSVNIALHAVVG